MKAHADVVITNFKLNDKNQNWLHDYNNLRHDILRNIVDTTIYDRNRTEESKVHEWIVVAINGNVAPVRPVAAFGKLRYETKSVQVVLRRQQKPAVPGQKPGGAQGMVGAQPPKGNMAPPHGGQLVGPGGFGPPQGFPPPQQQQQQQPPPPPPMPLTAQAMQQAIMGGGGGPGPRNNGMGGGRNNNGPPGGFAPGFGNSRVAQYVDDLPSDRDELETIEHLEYKRRGGKDSKPAMRMTGALPPVSPRLRRRNTAGADDRRDDRRGDRDRDRDDRRRDEDRDRERHRERERGAAHHHRTSRHARLSKHHTHEGGYRSDEELDYEYDRRSDGYSETSSVSTSSLNTLEDLRRRIGGANRPRHSFAGDLHRTARDSHDILAPPRRSRRHEGGRRGSVRRVRSAERIVERERERLMDREALAALNYHLSNSSRRAEASAAAVLAAANTTAAAAAATAAATRQQQQREPDYYPAPAPRLIEAPPLTAYYADADRRFDDYPPVGAHPPTPPPLARPFAYRSASDRPRGGLPLAPLAPPTGGDYYSTQPRRRSFYGGELDPRGGYDRGYDRAHAATSPTAGPPPTLPRAPLAPPPLESPRAAAGGYRYPLNRAHHSSRQQEQAQAQAHGLGLASAPSMSRRQSGYAPSEPVSDHSRSSFDSRSDEGGTGKTWRELERLRGRIEDIRDEVEWSRGANYQRRREA
jgi:hypothetical protein